MTIINIEEATDPWVDLSGHSERFRRAVRRMVDFSFSPDAELVLAKFINKFIDGCEEHGDLDLDTIDPVEMMLEEHIDNSMYAVMEIIKRQRRAGKFTA